MGDGEPGFSRHARRRLTERGTEGAAREEFLATALGASLAPSKFSGRTQGQYELCPGKLGSKDAPLSLLARADVEAMAMPDGDIDTCRHRSSLASLRVTSPTAPQT